MTKEMEFAKCMALLRKAVRMELITEVEYIIARNKLMDRFFITKTGGFYYAGSTSFRSNKNCS